MIDSQRGALAIYNLMSNKHERNNCFIKNNSEILLDLADFALQEQQKDNLMVSISRAWYNGSYTMAAKPIKSLHPIALYNNNPVFNNSKYPGLCSAD